MTERNYVDGHKVRPLEQAGSAPAVQDVRFWTGDDARDWISWATASGNGKREYDGEFSSYFFHLATSLRLNRVLASESSRARGHFATLAITCHKFFSRSPFGCHGAVQR